MMESPNGNSVTRTRMETDGSNVNQAFDDDEAPGSKFAPIAETNTQAVFTLELQEQGAAEEEYDPYSNRKVEHPTTNAETLLHLLKGSLGTGILAMPNAFAQAGYVVGSVGTVIIGILCTYCIHMLVKSEYEMCKRRKVPSMSYTQVAEEALKDGPWWMVKVAPHAPITVNVFLLIYQLGACCIYVVFVSENLKTVVNIYTGNQTDVKTYMCMIVIPLIIINWVRNLKYLAPLSTIANAITVVSFAIIAYYIFREPLSTEGRVAFGSAYNFPLFFGTVLFALEAIGVILPLENEMKTPKSFGGSTGVLNRGMVTIVILYVAMGLFGYLRYGDDAAGSITLNLPGNLEVLAQVVQLTLALAIFVTHALACYVAIDIVWREYIVVRMKPDIRGKICWEYLTRTCIVLITFLLAVAVPALDLFISLFGALCLSALGLAFPAIIESCVWWRHQTTQQRIIMSIKNLILVVVGVIGLVVGTYSSLAGLYAEFAGGPAEQRNVTSCCVEPGLLRLMDSELHSNPNKGFLNVTNL